VVLARHIPSLTLGLEPDRDRAISDAHLRALAVIYSSSCRRPFAGPSSSLPGGHQWPRVARFSTGSACVQPSTPLSLSGSTTLWTRASRGGPFARTTSNASGVVVHDRPSPCPRPGTRFSGREASTRPGGDGHVGSRHIPAKVVSQIRRSRPVSDPNRCGRYILHPTPGPSRPPARCGDAEGHCPPIELEAVPRSPSRRALRLLSLLPYVADLGKGDHGECRRSRNSVRVGCRDRCNLRACSCITPVCNVNKSRREASSASRR
jgi:hypothetical protein